MALRKNTTTAKATPNTVTAMKRSATNRQCPACHRKSALKFHSDDLMFGHACRWCGWEHMTARD